MYRRTMGALLSGLLCLTLCVRQAGGADTDTKAVKAAEQTKAAVPAQPEAAKQAEAPQGVKADGVAELRARVDQLYNEMFTWGWIFAAIFLAMGIAIWAGARRIQAAGQAASRNDVAEAEGRISGRVARVETAQASLQTELGRTEGRIRQDIQQLQHSLDVGRRRDVTHAAERLIMALQRLQQNIELPQTNEVAVAVERLLQAVDRLQEGRGAGRGDE